LSHPQLPGRLLALHADRPGAAARRLSEQDPRLARRAQPAGAGVGAGVQAGPAGRHRRAIRGLPRAVENLRPRAAAMVSPAALGPGSAAVRPRAVRTLPGSQPMGNRMRESSCGVVANLAPDLPAAWPRAEGLLRLGEAGQPRSPGARDASWRRQLLDD